MSDTDSSNSRERDSVPEGGILAALPRARPQRASPRRAAARASKPKNGKPAGARAAKKPAASKKRVAEPIAKPNAEPNAKPERKARTRSPNAKSMAKPPAEPPGGRAPSQGYEPEEEMELGTTVDPPSGAELVESVADIIGELASSGVAAGGRLLKDAFSLLRRP
jgi:hypothetical protein